MWPLVRIQADSASTCHGRQWDVFRLGNTKRPRSLDRYGKFATCFFSLQNSALLTSVKPQIYCAQ